MILTSRKDIIFAYFFAHKPLSRRSPSLPYIFYFLKKEIMELSLLCVFWIAPSLIMPPSVQSFKFFFRDYAMWNKIYLQGLFSWKIFWNFKVVPNIKTILMSISNKLVQKKIQVIHMGKFESLCFVVLVKV